MSSPWEKPRIHVRFNQKMDDLLTDEFIEYLDREYDGPTVFLESALRKEKKQKTTLDERIEKLDQKEDEVRSKKQRLIEKKRERQKKDKLDKKKRELKDLQKELQTISNEGLTTREDAEEEVLKSYRNRVKYSDMSDPEIKDDLHGFERMVEDRMDDQEHVRNLVDDIEELQDEICELNGGDDLDWFVDPLQKVEVRSS
jgi:DNA repair exonuclease SbcCD ATPase subunit